jgi:hypothetical protein
MVKGAATRKMPAASGQRHSFLAGFGDIDLLEFGFGLC